VCIVNRQAGVEIKAMYKLPPSRSAEGGSPKPSREVIFRPPTNFVLASPRWSERSEVSSQNSFLPAAFGGKRELLNSPALK